MTALYTPAAGDNPTAAQFDTYRVRYARKTSDTSLSTSTLTADAALALANLSISVEYEITAYILHRSAGSTNLNLDFTFPTGAQVDNFTFQTVAAGSTFGITAASGAVTGINNTTTNRITIIRGTLVMSTTAGTLQFRWAAATGTVIVATGSYIKAQQVT